MFLVHRVVHKVVHKVVLVAAVLVAQTTAHKQEHKQEHKAEHAILGLDQVAQLLLIETLMVPLLAMLVTVHAVRLVLVVHLVDVRLVRVVEPYLQFRELTDRLFMSEDLQGQTTEPIAHSLEPGQFPTQAELIP